MPSVNGLDPARSSSMVPQINKLVEWAVSHGAVLHPSVEVYVDAATGTSFRAAHGPTESGAEIISCPTVISLSYLNLLPGTHLTTSMFHRDQAGSGSDCPFPAFPDRFVAECPPHVSSRFLLVREFLKGRSSFWAPYIDSLPRPGSDWMLPPFWPAEDAELLKGTLAGHASEEIRATVGREYAAAMALLRECAPEAAGPGGWEIFSEDLYNWAYSVFSSRSFRPSLVVPDAELVERELPHGVLLKDFAILLPLLDIGNHDVTAQARWEAPPGSRECIFSSLTPRPRGAQIFNNYGMKTNNELLLAYGFVVPETDELHNDYFLLRKRSAGGSGNPSDRTVFLVSLRPMDHESSHIGRSRRIVHRRSLSSPVLPAFAHVEDAMIWDMVQAQTTPEQRSSIFPSSDSSGREQLASFLTGSVVGKEGRALLHRTLCMIFQKIGTEWEKLAGRPYESGEEPLGEGRSKMDEEEKPKPTNKRQELAMMYRCQCSAVLTAALESVLATEPIEDSSDGGEEEEEEDSLHDEGWEEEPNDEGDDEN